MPTATMSLCQPRICGDAMPLLLDQPVRSLLATACPAVDCRASRRLHCHAPASSGCSDAESRRSIRRGVLACAPNDPAALSDHRLLCNAKETSVDSWPRCTGTRTSGKVEKIVFREKMRSRSALRGGEAFINPGRRQMSTGSHGSSDRRPPV